MLYQKRFGKLNQNKGFLQLGILFILEINCSIPKELRFVKNLNLVLPRITGSMHLCFASDKNQYKMKNILLF